jgi:hypothetical protein
MGAGILAAAGLGAGAGRARADIITLDVSASMRPTGGTCLAAGCALGGDIVINNGPGVTNPILSEDVTASGFSPSVGPFTMDTV